MKTANEVSINPCTHVIQGDAKNVVVVVQRSITRGESRVVLMKHELIQILSEIEDEPELPDELTWMTEHLANTVSERKEHIRYIKSGSRCKEIDVFIKKLEEELSEFEEDLAQARNGQMPTRFAGLKVVE